MNALPTLRTAAAALATLLIAAPAAHASSYGPAMTAAQIRSFQAQGVQEIIVKRQPGLSSAGRADLRAQAGISYVGPGPLPDTEVDRAPVGGLAAAVAALRSDPAVQYAEPNGLVHATGMPNDPFFSDQWALQNTGQLIRGTETASGTAGDDIGATAAWAQTIGTGVTVAVVDTGLDPTAPDLQGQTVPGVSFVGGVEGPTTPDGDGHGTHVSGIIAAAQNNGIGVSGVAPGAKVMPLQALDSTGSGSIDDVAAAFNWAGNNSIPIVNASLGGPVDSQTLEDAVSSHPNTLYVVAAGNDGTNDDGPSTPFYPCDSPDANVICVGASDQNDQPASFSNFGPTNVDLFAPGVNILSTWLTSQGGYAYADGTSMATPMVSATLALMAARNPTLTSAELKSELLASVVPVPQLAGLAVTGGRLDAAAAVNAAAVGAPYVPPPPTVPAAAPSPAPAPAGAPVLSPVHAPLATLRPLRLTRVSLTGRAGAGRGQALVFRLSAPTRVQISLARAGHARGAAADVLRVALRARRGQNRYWLSALLHGRHLPRGSYVLTLRAGNRTVTLRINA